MQLRKMKWILLLMCVVVCVIPYQNISASSSKEIEQRNMLIRTDAATGETTYINIQSEEYSIQTKGDRNSYGSTATVPRQLIGSDNRTKVSNVNVMPYSAIARIKTTYTDGAYSWGTGFMVSGRSLLTAAHAVTSYGRTTQKIELFLKCNGNVSSPSATASSWYVCASYDSSLSTDYDDDYAIVIFPSNTSTNWLGLHVPGTPSSIDGLTATVSGYPNEKTGSDQHTQWYASGKIDAVNTHTLYHLIDTTSGQSGSPVYRYNSTYGYQADAIHVGTYGDVNVGRRMTSELFDWLIANGFIS